MDGQRVKAWEARCIEEQPPACSVGCPLRVDVRGMLAKAKAGDFAGACAIYARSVALPAVLGRLCDHPCETVCRRAEAGGAIRIGAVERACVEAAAETIRRAPPRARKAKRVAVVGAGLSGLTAAFDLAMKGCAVTVFEAEPRPLTRLTRDYSGALPPAAIEADVAALVKLGVEVFCQSRVEGGVGPLGLETLIDDYDAVLLAIGAGSAAPFAGALNVTVEGQVAIDPTTRAASRAKSLAAARRARLIRRSARPPTAVAPGPRSIASCKARR